MEAKRLKAGLIVLTTHGRTGLSHILMGSTAERVVRCAMPGFDRPPDAMTAPGSYGDPSRKAPLWLVPRK
jgi:hypothetical protein